jgi:hypothetical protein
MDVDGLFIDSNITFSFLHINTTDNSPNALTLTPFEWSFFREASKNYKEPNAGFWSHPLPQPNLLFHLRGRPNAWMPYAQNGWMASS